MASHVVVIDSTFRRSTVKVTPGTFMTDVLDEACSKLKLNASNYGLKNNNKPVDLSRTFRQTGLTTGAKLELVAASRTPTAISVALQVPESIATGIPGGRLTDKIASDNTLWRILRHFEGKPGLNLNFTARGVTELENGASGAGRIYYEMPVLNFMGRELSSFGDLQKTLSQLGLSGGSCLLRLTFRKTAQPLEEAMKEIGTYFKDETTNTAGNEAPVEQTVQQPDPITETIANLASAEVSGSEPTGDASDAPTAPSATEVPNPNSVTPSKRSAPEQSEAVPLGPDQRLVSVFAPPSGDTPVAALQPHNDDDYEPTVAHAKLHQSRLLNNTQNKRLLSDAETERAEQERAAKLAATKEVSIKVRFPDQSTIVSIFKANETGADLYQFVKNAIVAEDQPFKLVWTDKGSSTVPSDEKKSLIKNLGFSGRVLVTFHWEDGASTSARQQPLLKPDLRQSAQEVKVPEVAAVESKELAGPSLADTNLGNEGKSAGGDGKKKGMPKWFKGLGKK